MTPGIAIVGMACRYPDARSPAELWENVLAGRRAFRRIPDERLRLDDYLSDDASAADATYSGEAAVLEGYEFDRARFRVVGSTFRAADMAHWLALDVADAALADAGFPDADGMPRDATGVLVGNSLTGEFSRANLMRLRWPYVRRVVDAELADEGWSSDNRERLLASLETKYKSPFPPVGDETLAGGLSNTIAGRICNHFDLKGGGYTVDAACASSLLAIANACSALQAGDVDAAIAGGVDLSLDPFELIGFAKVGALARDEMRVYDARSAGFWPGEGCGMVVLMRHEEAVKQGRRAYAVIRGWGVSSDGSGGITRPEVAGQKLAIERAYRRADFGIETVAYFEGHGTGTAVGDAAELEALSQARCEAAADAPPAAIGSIKANIGHTKAAAGVAGLIKAALATHHGWLPPSTGWQQPHPAFGDAPALELLSDVKSWAPGPLRRAAVSAMGFGGINTHLVLEATGSASHRNPSPRQRMLASTPQDAELFVFSADSREALAAQMAQVAAYAARLSRAELTDLAAELARNPPAQHRAAIVASTPAELHERLVSPSPPRSLAPSSHPCRAPTIGFLFSGQGAPGNLSGGAWARRFEEVKEIYARAGLAADADPSRTEIAQPAIVTASLAGLRLLARLGIEAAVAIGHSLGELSAYHWAGVFDDEALLRIAAARGKAMADLGRVDGAMAGIAAGAAQVAPLLAGLDVVIAGINSPAQTVVSGTADDVDAVLKRAGAASITAVRLPVSRAFHSPLVAACEPALSAALAGEAFQRPTRAVASTITGRRLAGDEDLGELLRRQLTAPVRLMDAVRAAGTRVDLWIEIGPGSVLGGIVRSLVDVPVVSLDAGGESLRPLLEAVGLAYALGTPLDCGVLFCDRFSRPFDLEWQPKFLTSPCEQAPASSFKMAANVTPAVSQIEPAASTPRPGDDSPLEVVKTLVARHTELPISAVKEDLRLLSDLHLTSLAVGQVVAEASRRFDLAPPAALTQAANATVAEIAAALEEQRMGKGPRDAPTPSLPPGVDSWTAAFTIQWTERPLARNQSGTNGKPGAWKIIAPDGHPLTDALQSKLSAAGGRGVVVCLPRDDQNAAIDLLLAAAGDIARDPAGSSFVLVDQGQHAAAFAKTLHLEWPQVHTWVIEVPPDHAEAVDWIVAESQAVSGFVHVRYDEKGTRSVPWLEALPLPDASPTISLDADDVLLVTGGGKGIAAECALELAKETGVRLALVGRSRRDDDAELSENLARFEAAGVRFRYLTADVTDADSVATAVEQVQSELGTVTAVLHGAGRNVPQLIGSLDRRAFDETLAPKVRGLQNVLAAVDPEPLRLLITFGSIIARAGMRGEADYALANAWLAARTEAWQRLHPHCRCLALEWSVWSGVGMGERLGRIESLRREGIMPIPPDEGVRMLRRLIGVDTPVSVVVTGRFGDAPTLRLKPADLPLLRFLEQPRVVVPGVELVADSSLSAATDPYLSDHVYQGAPLFAAVMGLEAMAQAAMALVGKANPPVFEQVRFERPIVVPDGSQVTLRVAALRRGSNEVHVVLRSEETGFHVDHFRAVCRFGEQDVHVSRHDAGDFSRNGADLLPLDAGRDLYGNILFHEGRFQRVKGYRRLCAKECLAEISPSDSSPWFGQYLPAQLVLGDAAVRDAVIHAIQACIPHGTLLPTGIERLIPQAGLTGPVTAHARERRHEGNDFLYDVEVTDASGAVCERWEGLGLRRVGEKHSDEAWVVPLLGPYLERRIGELLPDSDVSIAAVNDAADMLVEVGGGRDSERAIRQAAGTAHAVFRRPDGKPHLIDGPAVSASHAAGLTLAVSGNDGVACDTEPVSPRSSEQWRDLLGQDRFKLAERVAQSAGEPLDASATRVWSAAECLTKAQTGFESPLILRETTADGWVLLTAGNRTVATWVAAVTGKTQKLAFTVLVPHDVARV